jgi:dolichol-phosphate mannosyltransferase
MPEHPELPPIAAEPLSVVLPAWNEDSTLAEVIQAWVAYLDGLGREYELLVVEDGSTDGTGALLDTLTQQFNRVRVLRHEMHQGLGAALRTGIAAARHPLLLCTDCDSVQQPADLQLLLDQIDKVHLVASFRRGRGARVRGWFGTCAYRWFVRWIFGVRVKDVDCPLKLFRRAIFSRIPLQSNGTFAQAEIVAKANFLGCLLTEVALPDRLRTRPQPALTVEPLRQTLHEANWVFHQPDFGPPVLPEDEPKTTTPAAPDPDGKPLGNAPS